MGMIADLFVKLGFKGEEFNKGVDESKNKAEGLKASLSNMGDKIAKAFGLEGFKDNISNLVSGVGSFSSSLMNVSGGASIFSGAMKIVRGAMISTGIGALVVAFGSLVAYFTQTERGAEMLERAMAGLKAGFKVLIDHAALFGEGMFKLFTGDFKGGFDTLKQSISGVGTEMMKESKAAIELESRLQALDDKERGLIKSLAERKQKAAELLEQAKDENTSADKKRGMVLEAKNLLISVFDDEKNIAEERSKIERERFEMSEKRDDQEKKVIESEARVNEIEKERADTLRGLSRQLTAATKAGEEYKKQLDENKPLPEAPRPIAIPAPELKPLDTSKYMDSGLDMSAIERSLGAGTEKFNKLLEPIQNFTNDLNNVISNGMNEAVNTFAEGIGALMSGDMNIGDFGLSILSTIGSFLVQMGQMLIAYALAMDAFKKAFTNPFIALAAGVALVAIGSMVSSLAKKGMSAGGGGGGGGDTGGGGGGATSSAMGGASSAATAMGGNVSFQIQGSSLVGVLANNDKKNSNYK